jgi:transcriptional regulator with XRE-family HTH domain
MTNTQRSGSHDRLTSERQRLKLTQEKVAAATGVSTATLIGYEQGLRSPPTEFTSRLLPLGFDVHYVMFGSSSSDFASDTLDWELLGRIVTAIYAWCKSRGFEMKPEKFGEVLRILYNESRRQPAEVFDVGRVLKLVA